MVDNPNLLSTGARDRIVCHKTSKQMKSCTLTMGYHNGKLNTLPSTWQYPNGCIVIQRINLWLIGNRKDNVPPLEISGVDLVSHIDNGSRSFSEMRQVMSKVEYIGREDKVWVPYSQWDGEKVNKLWSNIWCKLDPYMPTKSLSDKNSSTTYHKSRQGQIAWRTCYKKMYAEGLFKGNKIRKKKGGSIMFSTSQYN